MELPARVRARGVPSKKSPCRPAFMRVARTFRVWHKAFVPKVKTRPAIDKAGGFTYNTGYSKWCWQHQLANK